MHGCIFLYIFTNSVSLFIITKGDIPSLTWWRAHTLDFAANNLILYVCLCWEWLFSYSVLLVLVEHENRQIYNKHLLRSAFVLTRLVQAIAFFVLTVHSSRTSHNFYIFILGSFWRSLHGFQLLACLSFVKTLWGGVGWRPWREFEYKLSVFTNISCNPLSKEWYKFSPETTIEKLKIQ